MALLAGALIGLSGSRWLTPRRLPLNLAPRQGAPFALCGFGRLGRRAWTPETRIDDIEVLRAFAISLVLVEHVRLNLLPWLAGVDDPLYGRFAFWLREPAWLGRGPLPVLLSLVFLVLLPVLSGPAWGVGNYRVGAAAALGAAVVWIASYDRDYLFPRGRFSRSCAGWGRGPTGSILFTCRPIWPRGRSGSG